MLSFFRRHRGAFLFALTFIIIVTFSLWGGWKQTGDAVGPDENARVLTMFDKDYSQADVGRLVRPYYASGGQGFPLAYQFAGFEAFQVGSIVQQLVDKDGRVPYDMIANILTLRKVALEAGVSVSNEEAQAKLMTSMIAQDQQTRQFSLERLKQFEDSLGAYGLTTEDVLQVIKDVESLGKLKKLVSQNYSASSYEAEKTYQAEQQTIKASTLSLALADFKAKAEVKDDAVAKYFEENKDSYKTAEKRAISYVLFDMPKEDSKLTAEQNQAATKAAAAKANDFDKAAREPDADFAAIAKAAGLKVETLASFTRAEPPAAIKEETTLVSEVFFPGLKVGGIGKPAKGSKGGYYFFKLDKAEEPKPQELKDVKDSIKEQLVAKKAKEDLTTAANDIAKVLKDGLKAGKKLEDLAKEKALKVEVLPEFTPGNPPPSITEGAKIAAEAKWVAPGAVSKSIETDTGVIFVAVTAKELRKSDSSATLKQSNADSAATKTGESLFKSWFAVQRKAGAEQWPDLK